MKTSIKIDPAAGPCFGVQRAIQMAEDYLDKEGELKSLGDLIHNNEEIKRLENKGLRTISHCQLAEQHGKKILIRAHGEPLSTFRIAENYHVELIDATCPIIKKLQKYMALANQEMIEQNGQIILFGDLYHPEVIALTGNCKGDFHIVANKADIKKIDVGKPSIIFSQTTQYQSDYHKIVDAFKRKRIKENAEDTPFEVIDSVCKYVLHRDLQLIDFLSDIDILIFVSGRKSSNGKYLFEVGKHKVKSAHLISHPDELRKSWFKSGKNIGISGATSTPLWLIENVQARIVELLS